MCFVSLLLIRTLDQSNISICIENHKNSEICSCSSNVPIRRLVTYSILVKKYVWQPAICKPISPHCIVKVKDAMWGNS